MAHPNRSKRRDNAKKGPVTKKDLFNMVGVATGGKSDLYRKVFGAVTNSFSPKGTTGTTGGSVTTPKVATANTVPVKKGT